MADDIRLHTTFFRHPKTVKLMRKCGTEGVLCLLKLWCFVREEKPDGIIDGGQEDVEIAAEWGGTPSELYNALIEVKFIVKQDSGKTSLKNWAKRNPWAVGAVTRQLKAKKGGCAKHGKSCATCQEDCPNSAQSCYELKQAPAPSPILSSPSPLPKSKDIVPQKRFIKPTLEQVKEYCEERGNNIDPETFIAKCESNGWTVGKYQAPMKNWKSTIITWEKNAKTSPQASDEERDSIKREIRTHTESMNRTKGYLSFIEGLPEEELTDKLRAEGERHRAEIARDEREIKRLEG